ncbi:tRNA (adenosine(37)-N6)-threonylcarbamoyltransferase complex ATPase subunit type 1 TsaE [Chromobacterium subtsugae]|uniref:tRNA threonylcarbamoyladenosine biosynthesis protein TsaE n=2 Tax=Chromobacteriaceae TaxID=1499392 RepID=A0ABS7FGF1_9NEIS|nr:MULTISPECIES: tRNA (adenosine(37)-N6)-threonylcarbamoyltransferase complex ATPase subunit type 1 TsaE [Chromobacterium]KUM00016.1 tRNA threonylcarbamoyladenosine biosynthesis protein TsaE [Chromobacterium subtsugae]KZE86312.1 tRNA threonylcarbamoyladenosine biosynthesis protein TsaE [Chromobacterium sp. F49]MBW7567934.1 tRNA (adenosine(37)-N6)-threonylcarbamoyltransferase complex ATPase subunit type 1 TsaE [Chromobacterium subtsugae]MBW8289161.1 tRNA (adenosine(37)-N6)-threonylcarbamoyltrans
MAMDDTSVHSGSLPDEGATLALGAAFAAAAAPGLTVQLHGDLGAGKTTFTRGLLRALGHAGKVKSPTYTLVESYALNEYSVHHFDLYRFADPEEWNDAGFSEYFGQDSLCLVEWPDKAGDLLPPADIVLELAVAGEGRTYHFKAQTQTGQSCLNRLSTPSAARC